MPDLNIPIRMSPFRVYGVVFRGMSGDQYFGDCPFCGHENKFYVNPQTLQWDCKHGRCGKRGNLITFLEEVLHELAGTASREDFQRLSNDRGLPIAALMESGLVWDGEKWLLPIRNVQGRVVNIRTYRYGQKLMNTRGLESCLYGAETLNGNREVWLCEGEWDAIAMKDIASQGGAQISVVAIPGADVFKDQWATFLKDKDVIIAYDADEAGTRGAEHAHQKLQRRSSRVRILQWPETVPQGTDLRDLYRAGGDWDDLQEMLVPSGISPHENGQELRSTPELRDFSEVVEGYRRWLHLTTETENAIRLMYAVYLSNQIPGDPLWMYLVAPPGGCKTELLMSLASCDDSVVRSTLTPHSMVSGFSGQGGSDPSLIPHIDKRVFILKDFTEVLEMNKTARDEVYSVLRGAYDGYVEKSFGNGIVRTYTPHFSMLAGVTHQIYGDRTASLGERFLMYSLVRGVAFDAEASIRAAVANVSCETDMRSQLQDLAVSYLSTSRDMSVLPEVPEEFQDKLVSLAQLVAMLRGSVEKDFRSERLLYRPQHEVGTRLAKQLKKLIISLGLLNADRSVGAREYSIVLQVAFDTCTGFNLDIVKVLFNTDVAQTAAELAEETKIPLTTLRDKLEDMEMLGVLEKERTEALGRGAPASVYTLSSHVRRLWETAIGEEEEIPETPRVRIRVRGVRRRQ